VLHLCLLYRLVVSLRKIPLGMLRECRRLGRRGSGPLPSGLALCLAHVSPADNLNGVTNGTTRGTIPSGVKPFVSWAALPQPLLVVSASSPHVRTNACMSSGVGERGLVLPTFPGTATHRCSIVGPCHETLRRPIRVVIWDVDNRDIFAGIIIINTMFHSSC